LTRPREGILHPGVNATDHTLGPADAPVTLVEYGDFQCPYCHRAHSITMELQRRFGDQLRFVFRNFPVSELHPHAAHAAESAESVAVHTGEGAYWRMHDAIFEHQQDSDEALDDEHLLRYAAQSGADPAAVKRDLASGTYRPRVRDDFVSGVRSGVTGTPTFFINGVRFDGDWTNVDELAAALADAMRAEAAGRQTPRV
jgi:protein-disulfide isomerase